MEKLWYCIINGGDGSAYPRFFRTEEAAEAREDEQDEGWGESSVSYVEVEKIGDKL